MTGSAAFLLYSIMIADKLQHNLIKINQLVSEEEPIRYIIPLYYNAVKHPLFSSNVSAKTIIKSKLHF